MGPVISITSIIISKNCQKILQNFYKIIMPSDIRSSRTRKTLDPRSSNSSNKEVKSSNARSVSRSSRKEDSKDKTVSSSKSGKSLENGVRKVDRKEDGTRKTRREEDKPRT